MTLAANANIYKSICRWRLPSGCAGLYFRGVSCRRVLEGQKNLVFVRRRKWVPLLCIQQSPEAKDISRHMWRAGLPAGHAGFSWEPQPCRDFHKQRLQKSGAAAASVCRLWLELHHHEIWAGTSQMSSGSNCTQSNYNLTLQAYVYTLSPVTSSSSVVIIPKLWRSR